MKIGARFIFLLSVFCTYTVIFGVVCFGLFLVKMSLPIIKYEHIGMFSIMITSLAFGRDIHWIKKEYAKLENNHLRDGKEE